MIALLPLPGLAQELKPATLPPAADHDGAHDFDFNFGVWHTHIRRTVHPLSGSTETVEMNGTVTVRKLWDGRGQVEEIEADGPNGHLQGMTLFLYNPQSRQWSQIFASSRSGTLDEPQIGSFTQGRGELFAHETLDGKPIIVRATWSEIQPDTHHFEEDYSGDGGKTWEPVFVASLMRAKG